MNEISTSLAKLSGGLLLGKLITLMLLGANLNGSPADVQFKMQRPNGTAAIAIQGLPGQRMAIESKSVLDALQPPGWIVIDRLTLNDQGSYSLARSTNSVSEFFRIVPEINRYWTNVAIIPEGEFIMGSADWGPIHSVMVSEFAIDCYEVAKVHWDEVRAWAITNGYVLPVGKNFGNS